MNKIDKEIRDEIVQSADFIRKRGLIALHSPKEPLIVFAKGNRVLRSYYGDVAKELLDEFTESSNKYKIDLNSVMLYWFAEDIGERV